MLEKTRMSDTATSEFSAIARFPVADGCLMVGGIPLPQLAERVGSTPFFAYDRNLLTERIEHLRSCLPDSILLNYAVKANPMPAIVQHFAPMVDGFDVASAFEMKTALDTPMAPNHVGFAGPGKTSAELVQAMSAGITIEMESEGEMRRIVELAERRDTRPRVAIRVNPDFQVKGSAMRMGGGSAQFGVDAENVPAMLSALSDFDFEFVGFHIFCGSQNLRADILASTQEKTIDLAIRLSRHASVPIQQVNIGGGFGIPYFPKDTPFDLQMVGEKLDALLSDRVEKELPGTRIIVELGRYIVGEAGIYVSRIIDRKKSRGLTYLVTDGGLHHQLAASGNFGQVIRRNYPVAIGNRMNDSIRETVNVVGCLCTPLDLLADKVELPEAGIGDLVVVFQSGAYGRTASPTAFLGHPEPLEVLI
jgi:diaminopimelate decarboxylase